MLSLSVSEGEGGGGAFIIIRESKIELLVKCYGIYVFLQVPLSRS